MNILSSDILYHIFNVGKLNLNDIFSLALTCKTMYEFVEKRFKWKQFMRDNRLINQSSHLERRHCFDNLKYYLKSNCFICFKRSEYYIPCDWKVYHKIILSKICLNCYQDVFGYHCLFECERRITFKKYNRDLPEYLEINSVCPVTYEPSSYFYYHRQILTKVIRDKIYKILLDLKYKREDIKTYNLVDSIFKEIFQKIHTFPDLFKNVKTRALKNIIFENREWETPGEEK